MDRDNFTAIWMAKPNCGVAQSRTGQKRGSGCFIAGVTKPARPSTPEAETNPHQYDGPPRTAEQVAA